MALALYAGDDLEVCHDTRTWLRQGKSAIEGGYLIEGAALLQRAVREFLQADCDYWGVPRHRTLIGMAKSLYRAEQVTPDSYAVLSGIISTCNRVVRCEPRRCEDESHLKACLLAMHSFCDGTAYLDERSQA